MTKGLLRGWLLSIAVATVLVVPAAVKHRHAAASLRDDRTSGAASVRLREEAAAIAHAIPPWARVDSGRADDPALAQKFAALVTASGLPSTAVESFTPTPSTVIDIVPGTKNGSAIVRARASAALTNVTLPQLGRLLETWRTSARGWTITQIDLTPLRLSPADAARYAGGDLPLRVGLTIERLTATGLDALTPVLSPAPSTESKDVPR